MLTVVAVNGRAHNMILGLETDLMIVSRRAVTHAGYRCSYVYRQIYTNCSSSMHFQLVLEHHFKPQVTMLRASDPHKVANHVEISLARLAVGIAALFSA